MTKAQLIAELNVDKFDVVNFNRLRDFLENLINNVPDPVVPKYKVYSALLTQSGLNPPVATILENTLGDIVWTYSFVGEYLATLPGAFITDKTFILNKSNITGGCADILRADENTIELDSYPNSAPTSALTDGVLNEYSIEIRVYN